MSCINLSFILSGLLFVLGNAVGSSEEIPSFIKTCKQSDTRLGSCIRKSIINLRPYLSTGIPELQVPSMDPLFVDKLKISQSGGIQINAEFRNISISGATNFRLRSVRADVASDKFRMKIWFPSLVMRGIYELNGQLLMMPINGKGNCFGNFTDIDGVLSLKLKRINRRDDEYFKVDFIQIEFNIGGAKVQLDNLFENGDTELSKSMNHFINENWRMVAAELRPTLEKTISEILAEVANKFFEAFPIRKLFIK